MKIISIEFAAAEETHVQFFGQVVINVAAEQISKAGTAAGSIVVPVPSVAEDGTESTTDVTVEAELPVTFSGDGKAAVYVTFEFNDEVILVHHPEETWGSGGHTLSLYYPIENMIPNFTNTFNVYLRMEGGTGEIEMGGCIASISGQGMAAAPAWDGMIELEETVPRFGIRGGMMVRDYREVVKTETMELVLRSYSDTVRGRTGIGGFCRPVEME